MSTKHFSVGLDAGGSKTLLLAQCAGCPDRIDNRYGPGANPQRVGLSKAADVLTSLVRDVIQKHRPVDNLSVCAGVAGAGRTEEQAPLAEALRNALDDVATTVRVQVVHDALIALDAAYDTDSGLVVIAGTGSVVLARTADETLSRAGGWGHLLGDPGSGYAIGQAGLRAVADAYDGGTDTVLRTRLHETTGIDGRDSLIQTIYQDDFGIQTVAPLVLDAAAAGDEVASRILTTQTANLTQQVEWLLNRRENIAPRIALLGGMMQNEHYVQTLRQTLQDRLPDWSVRVLQEEPVVGALRRARRLSSQPTEEE